MVTYPVQRKDNTLAKWGDYPASWDDPLGITDKEIEQIASQYPPAELETLCDNINSNIWQLTQWVREHYGDTMLPAPSKGSPQPSSGGRRSGKNWLKVEHLSTDPVTAKVLGVETRPPSPKNFSDVIVKVSMRGTSYYWGLKADNPNFDILVSAWGRDENEWNGKYVKLFLEWNDFHEQNFIRCEPTDSPKAETTGKGRK